MAGVVAQALPGRGKDGGRDGQALPVRSIDSIQLPCGPADLNEYARLEEWMNLRAMLTGAKKSGLRQRVNPAKSAEGMVGADAKETGATSQPLAAVCKAPPPSLPGSSKHPNLPRATTGLHHHRKVMHVHDPQPYDGRTTEITSRIQGRSDQDLAISANQVLQIQQQRHPFVAGGTAPVLGRFYDVTTTDATSQPLAAVSNTAESAEIMVGADAEETGGAAGRPSAPPATVQRQPRSAAERWLGPDVM